MHIQIVSFNLREMSHADYEAFGAKVAPAFAEVPGLLSKTWLADEASNTYGGVYFWASKAAMEDFFQTDLFRAVVNNPNLANLTSKDFVVLDTPGRATRSFGAMAA
jgi:heme-degrading monooxygenase HmoA